MSTQIFEQTIAYLDHAIAQSPVNAKLWLNRGMIYSTQLDYANALINFNHALVLDPDLTEAYTRRAIVYLAIDRFEEAHADVDYALQVSSNPLLLKLKASLLLLVA
jgi:tetratricopeptide (TPR) repeat protein